MSAVAGFQLTLPERLSVRLDVGWPLTKDDIAPSDGKDVHTWVRVSKTF
jgi:hemolysin activation/secretion protein